MGIPIVLDSTREGISSAVIDAFTAAQDIRGLVAMALIPDPDSEDEDVFAYMRDVDGNPVSDPTAQDLMDKLTASFTVGPMASETGLFGHKTFNDLCDEILITADGIGRSYLLLIVKSTDRGHVSCTVLNGRKFDRSGTLEADRSSAIGWLKEHIARASDQTTEEDHSGGTHALV